MVDLYSLAMAGGLSKLRSANVIAQPDQFISEEDYLLLERASRTKHEYYHGRIYAMAGAKEAHNLIAGNVIASLHRQLRQKPCRVYPSDMRVKIMKTGLNTYPDVVVVCGQPQFTDDELDTISNPVVIIEILSPSTERYDRGMKFQHYRTIDTLRDYILIAQNHHHIEHFSRQDTTLWLFQAATEPAVALTIPSIECALLLQDVYEKVELQQETEVITRDIPPEE